MRASLTYLCSGMSRITPIAPKHSAASFAARSIASGAKASATAASGRSGRLRSATASGWSDAQAARHTAARADRVLYDESYYPATILELLSISSLCVHFFS